MAPCRIFLGAVFAFAHVVPTWAQQSDAAYCEALIGIYQRYLGSSGTGRHFDVDQNVKARRAIDQCRAGNFSGIADLEQELRKAKIDLPPRS